MLGDTFTFISAVVLLTSLSTAAEIASSVPTTTSASASAAASTTSCDRFRHTGFWVVDIDNYPDLPWYCDPPFSQHALRDRSKLPLESVGVAGAYVFCALFFGSALLTVGKRMRNNAMASNGTLEIEMVGSPNNPSLNSPASTSRSWVKKGISSLKSFGSGNSTRTSRAGSNPNSPGVASVSSFDSRVLQQDRDNRQAEMDRLYAAVMAH